MTTKHPCLILYSHKDIQSTGSAMTCRGFIETETVEYKFPYIDTSDPLFRATESIEVRTKITYLDHLGQPLPKNVHVWDYFVEQ